MRARTPILTSNRAVARSRVFGTRFDRRAYYGGCGNDTDWVSLSATPNCTQEGVVGFHQIRLDIKVDRVAGATKELGMKECMVFLLDMSCLTIHRPINKPRNATRQKTPCPGGKGQESQEYRYELIECYSFFHVSSLLSRRPRERLSPIAGEIGGHLHWRIVIWMGLKQVRGVFSDVHQLMRGERV